MEQVRNGLRDYWCCLDGTDVQFGYLRCPTPENISSSNIPDSPSCIRGFSQRCNNFTANHLVILLTTVLAGTLCFTCNMVRFCHDCISTFIFATDRTISRMKNLCIMGYQNDILQYFKYIGYSEYIFD